MQPNLKPKQQLWDLHFKQGDKTNTVSKDREHKSEQNKHEAKWANDLQTSSTNNKWIGVAFSK